MGVSGRGREQIQSHKPEPTRVLGVLEDVRCGWKPGGVGRAQMQGGVKRQMLTALPDVRSVLSMRPSHLQGAGCRIHRAASPTLLSVVMGWWGKKPRQDLG